MDQFAAVKRSKDGQPIRYLIVDDPINNRRYDTEQNDQKELHLRLYRNRRFYPAGLRAREEVLRP